MNNLENLRMVVPKNPARAIDEQTAILRDLMSGSATWEAMIRAVEHLRRIAPKDHDVFVMVSDVAVHEAYFLKPHTFLFKGINNDGHDTWIGLHFSQLAFGVVHRPKYRKEPVITGFSPHAPPSA